MTKKKENMEADKVLQSIMAQLDELKSVNTKDFKEISVDAIKELLQYCINLNRAHKEDLEEIVKVLQGRFKLMDKAITELYKFSDDINDLRHFLLFHTARVDCVCNKLIEGMVIGKVEAGELYREVWDDSRVELLGFDCKAQTLRKRYMRGFKNLRKESVELRQ